MSRLNQNLRVVALRPDILPSIVLGAVSLYTLLKIVTGVGLFADGSNFLVHILATQDFFVALPNRLFTYLLTQSPVVFGVRLGLRSLNELTLIFSFGLIGIPAGLWMWALWRIRNSPSLFWILLMLFAGTYLNCDLFPAGEYNTAMAIAVVSTIILLKSSPLFIWERICLFIFAVGSNCTYESFVFFGPLLAAAALIRSFKCAPDSIGEKWWLRIFVLLFTSATFFSAYNILFPPIAGIRNDAANIWQHLQNVQLVISFIFILLFAIQWFFTSSRLISTTLLVLGMPVLVLLFNPNNWASIEKYYGSRSLCSLTLFLGLSTIAGLRFSPPKKFDVNVLPTFGRLMPLALTALLLIVNCNHCFKLLRFNREFRRYVNSHTGLIPIASTPLYQTEYVWPWTNPTLSLLFRNNAEDALILNPVGVEWEPFNPRKTAPDLSGYLPMTWFDL